MCVAPQKSSISREPALSSLTGELPTSPSSLLKPVLPLSSKPKPEFPFLAFILAILPALSETTELPTTLISTSVLPPQVIGIALPRHDDPLLVISMRSEGIARSVLVIWPLVNHVALPFNASGL
ncbi:hypothetical protein ACFX2J_003296 [Malus domestica]